MDLDMPTRILLKKLAGEIAERISSRYNIPQSDILSCCNDLYDTECVDPVESRLESSSSSSDSSESSDDSECESVSSRISESTGTRCLHVLTRGPRKGKNCGSKISAKSTTGSYCVIHISQENKLQSTDDRGRRPPISRVVREADSHNTTSNIVISKDPKYGRYIHIPTQLVFRSSQEKIVRGVQDENGDVRPLTAEDIEVCKRYRFIYESDIE